MMKKKLIVRIIGLGVCVIVMLGIYFMKLHRNKATLSETAANLPKIVGLDKVARYPDRFKDYIGVSGRVVKVDASKGLFIMGCEDACILMPVKYKGQMPNPRREITVYGKIKKHEEGKYIFEAQEVKVP